MLIIYFSFDVEEGRFSNQKKKSEYDNVMWKIRLVGEKKEQIMMVMV